MDFAPSARGREYAERVKDFMDAEIAPAEEPLLRRRLAAAPEARWQLDPVMAELKDKARDAGLWNLFLPDVSGLSNVDYAPLAELMGRSVIAAEVFNCNAPDTGNMEVLHQFGSPEQKEQWLKPLLEGRIRSAFCMTEPEVASSDATTMRATAAVVDGGIVLNGRKWFSTGVGHPDCRVLLFMGVTDPAGQKYRRHSIVAVPVDAPGVRIERMLPVMGRYDEPSGHGEVSFTDVRLPLEAFVGGPGAGFEIGQKRLGPGRVHHCMRLIGLAEAALEAACRRGVERSAFGKPLVNLGGNRERIAEARIAINQARLLVLYTAWLLDTQGVFGALSEISQIKVAVPSMAQNVIDMAIQLHGGAGLTDDTFLAGAWTIARALRLADGPDEVHRGVVARLELGRYGMAR
ncbi:acyl-CoA dehydrogenase family protein [Catenulispora sp. NF23]|uniref:Acyl-CoA dehydrogenase family protein n=1 Tax=Catenulispora pinistramenti TaxID=2705254 RepID=A0ABS5L499_9ACTN|nr:acyl-CoA dehydrogenase family protein [Catenulispora pinistramenti]MBS2536938.1 acyl-CoA dehydrogenase family protein [Catenulispora pinistramenti]MBS2553039.1 acyl-CoA dehydrogenase family protein [Catenulispora pinistramenti]